MRLRTTEKGRRAAALQKRPQARDPVRTCSGLSCGLRRTGLKTGYYEELGGEEFAKDVVDGLGVGLAAGGFHNLADEEFEDTFVAGFEFGDVVGILGDDFSGGLLDRGIADLGAETFGGDDFGGGAAGLEHGGENLFADGGGDFGGFD